MTVHIYVDEMLKSLTFGYFLEYAVFPYFSIKMQGISKIMECVTVPIMYFRDLIYRKIKAKWL